jgi:HPt (histidine-containing phosphotransfer) domain-containing protein
MIVLDRAHFDHMTAADRALQAEIIGLFRMQAEVWREGLARRDRDTLHTLKGSARGIGLHALAAACEAAEAGSERGLTEVLAALDQALAALEHFAAEAK